MNFLKIILILLIKNYYIEIIGLNEIGSILTCNSMNKYSDLMNILYCRHTHLQSSEMIFGFSKPAVTIILNLLNDIYIFS